MPALDIQRMSKVIALQQILIKDLRYNEHVQRSRDSASLGGVE